MKNNYLKQILINENILCNIESSNKKYISNIFSKYTILNEGDTFKVDTLKYQLNQIEKRINSNTEEKYDKELRIEIKRELSEIDLEKYYKLSTDEYIKEITPSIIEDKSMEIESRTLDELATTFEIDPTISQTEITPLLDLFNKRHREEKSKVKTTDISDLLDAMEIQRTKTPIPIIQPDEKISKISNKNAKKAAIKISPTIHEVNGKLRKLLKTQEEPKIKRRIYTPTKKRKRVSKSRKLYRPKRKDQLLLPKPTDLPLISKPKIKVSNINLKDPKTFNNTLKLKNWKSKNKKSFKLNNNIFKIVSKKDKLSPIEKQKYYELIIPKAENIYKEIHENSIKAAYAREKEYKKNLYKSIDNLELNSIWEDIIKVLTNKIKITKNIDLKRLVLYATKIISIKLKDIIKNLWKEGLQMGLYISILMNIVYSFFSISIWYRVCLILISIILGAGVINNNKRIKN